MKYLLVPFFCSLLFSCSNESLENESEPQYKWVTMPESDESEEDEIIFENSEPEYSSEVYYTEGQGWGYKILMDNKPYINQPHIPAITGNKGFSDEEKAQITADFAINKIKNGLMPPTISEDELDSLGVLN